MEITCPSCKVSSVRHHVYLSRTECQYCGAHFEVSALRNVRMNRRLMSASLPALNQNFNGQQHQQPSQQHQLQQQQLQQLQVGLLPIVCLFVCLFVSFFLFDLLAFCFIVGIPSASFIDHLRCIFLITMQYLYYDNIVR